MRLLLITLFCASFITFLIISLSFVSPFRSTPSIENIQTSATHMYFNPSLLQISCDNASHSANILLETNINSLQSAQIELMFNPNVFYNVSLSPMNDNIFGLHNEVLINEVREAYGRASFVIQSKDLLQNPNKNNLATVNFSVYPQPTSSSATISFLNKSNVQSTSSRESLLDKTTPLIIQCN